MSRRSLARLERPSRVWTVREANRYRRLGLYPGDPVFVLASVLSRKYEGRPRLMVRCVVVWIGEGRLAAVRPEGGTRARWVGRDRISLEGQP